MPISDRQNCINHLLKPFESSHSLANLVCFGRTFTVHLNRPLSTETSYAKLKTYKMFTWKRKTSSTLSSKLFPQSYDLSSGILKASATRFGLTSAGSRLHIAYQTEKTKIMLIMISQSFRNQTNESNDALAHIVIVSSLRSFGRRKFRLAREDSQFFG